MLNQALWPVVTGKLYNAVLIQIVCGVLAAIFGAFGGLTFGTTAILALIASIGAAVGYVLFFISLGEWRKIVDDNDFKAVNQLRTAALLTIIGSILSCIPLLGWIGGILCLVAWIMMLLSFSALKKSATFPESARLGAGKIHTSMIINIVAIVVGFIPVVGGFIAAVLEIVAFVFMFLGWRIIAGK